jgi:FkbM family methyltransferase
VNRILAFVIGDRRRVREVTFRENGLEFRCLVNEDNLWVAVKDNLILGEYEREGLRLDRFSGVVVDAGAHVGTFALLASTHAQSVVAIEAHPENFSMLQHNISRNHRTNVTAFHSALWTVGGTVEFVEGARTSEGAIRGESGELFSVPSITLDSITASTGPIDLLKLDIEGAEFDVLDAASEDSLSQISAIAAELHLKGRRDRLDPTLARLRSLGFTAVVRRPPLHNWKETMAAIWRHRRRLKGEVRLRLAVPVVYTLVALADPLFHVRERLEHGELAFLFATRTAPSLPSMCRSGDVYA